QCPGKRRKQENCVERAVALGNGTLIDLGDLPPSIAALNSPASRPQSESAAELVSDLAAAADLSSGESATALSTTDLEDIERATIQRVLDRKSTRLNSSHQIISYAVFCLKKKKHLPLQLT